MSCLTLCVLSYSMCPVLLCVVQSCVSGDQIEPPVMAGWNRRSAGSNLPQGWPESVDYTSTLLFDSQIHRGLHRQIQKGLLTPANTLSRHALTHSLTHSLTHAVSHNLALIAIGSPVHSLTPSRSCIVLLSRCGLFTVPLCTEQQFDSLKRMNHW